MFKETRNLIILAAIIGVVVVAYLLFTRWNDNRRLESLAERHPLGREILTEIRSKSTELPGASRQKKEEIYSIIAYDREQLGDHFGAIKFYNKALLTRKDNLVIFNNIAQIYIGIGDYEKAENYFRKIVNKSLTDIAAWRNLANLYRYHLTGGGEGKRPQDIYLEALQYNPNHPNLLSALAGYYQDTGNKEEAIVYYKKLLEVAPDNEAARNELEILQSSL